MIGPEFFPTPLHVAFKMLDKLSKDAVNFLEPSAGKGDIVEAINSRYESRYGGRRGVKVDCIEQDPNLISVLQGKGLPVVGVDFLTYTGVSYYDAIVMNPPFSNGDDHLLKAWDFLHDGEIVCLLNEETIKNPYTMSRQRLLKIIQQHGKVEYLGDCFRGGGAERRTDVKVAMVYLRKQSDDDRIEMWASVNEERSIDDSIPGSEENMLAIRDVLGNMQHYYDCANTHMLKAFQHLRKAALYLQANEIDSDRQAYSEILPLAMKNVNSARAEFIRKHRRDAWMKVFQKMHFVKWLDKKQREAFIRDIETNSTIQFTAENIKGTLENVLLQRKKLFEQSVANVFDELTRYYKGNTNHTEGWKTNDNYKVNQRIIFPHGCHFDSQFLGRFELSYGYCHSVIDIYMDLDRIMAVLDGEDFESILKIGAAMDHKFNQLGHHVKAPFDNRCESRYFRIKFWKKGTVHLEFKHKDLWEKFNVTAAAGKRWLGENTQRNAA